MTKGQRIRNARKKAGMTQTELAQKLNIPFQSISQWERDLRNPKLDTIQRIAKALHVSPAYLMGWENDFGEQDLILTAIDVADALKVSRVLMLDVMEDMELFDATDPETLRKISAEVERRKISPEILNEISYSLYKLNQAGRKKVSDYAEDLTKIPEYRAKISAENE